MTKERPLVSIVTPTFNSEAYLGDLLELVDAQTYDKIEHVFVDGASTDGTVDLIRQYAENHLTKWVSEPDESNVEATTKGLYMATGDIVVVVPSDDLIFPWTIKTVVDHFRAHPDTDVVHGDSVALDMRTGSWHLRVHKRFTFGSLARTQWLVPAAMYIRRDALSGNEELDTSFPHACDYDWIMRITRDRKVANIKEFLAIFRKRPGAVNLREDAGEQIIRETALIRAQHIKTSGLAHWVMVRWDRIYGAFHRRLQLVRLVRLSRRAETLTNGLNANAPWRNFLGAYSTSSTSTWNLLRSCWPGRSKYYVDVWSREPADSLGAAARSRDSEAVS